MMGICGTKLMLPLRSWLPNTSKNKCRETSFGCPGASVIPPQPGLCSPKDGNLNDGVPADKKGPCPSLGDLGQLVTGQFPCL